MERTLFLDAEGLAGKNVMLVDEAVLTGMTLRYVVKLLKDAGVKSVRAAIPSPVSTCRCTRGIINHLHSLYGDISPEEFAKELGLVELTHIDGSRFIGFLREKNIKACTECFEVK